MVRQRRYGVAGQPQHIIQRGNNRGPIFFGEGDQTLFIEFLAGAADRYGLAIHAYVLMPNHLHLLATPGEADSLSRAMQAFGRRYVRYVNRRHGRTGTLWEGRFRSTVVDSERYLMACMRYIDLNPVRAGLVPAPEGYPWSSHRHLAQGRADALVTPHPLYLALGPTPEARQASYAALCRQALAPEIVEALRHHTNAGWALGGRDFAARIATASGRRAAPLPRGRPSSQKLGADQ